MSITMGAGLPKYLFTEDRNAPRFVRANYGLGGWVAKNYEGYNGLFQPGARIPLSWGNVRVYMLQTHDMRQFACMLELQEFCKKMRRDLLLFADWENDELDPRSHHASENTHRYHAAIEALALSMASVGNGGLYAAHGITTVEGALELVKWDDP